MDLPQLELNLRLFKHKPQLILNKNSELITGITSTENTTFQRDNCWNDQKPVPMEQRNKRECSAGVNRAIFLLLMETQGKNDMKLFCSQAGREWSLLGAALGKEKALYPVYNARTGTLEHSPLLTWFLYFATPRGQGALTDTPKPQEQPGYDKAGVCPYPCFPRRSYPRTPNNSRSPGTLPAIPKHILSPVCKRLIQTESRYLISLQFTF